MRLQIALRHRIDGHDQVLVDQREDLHMRATFQICKPARYGL